MKTDQRLKEDVEAALRWDLRVHAECIAVTAHHGAVTLDGELPSHTEAWRAERAAQRVAGLSCLTVRLTVPRAPAGSKP
jgi:osmotically-inducible protein OsmY